MDAPSSVAGTPKPQEGTWTLVAPDGRKWTGESPLRVAGKEQRERVPAEVALQRIWAMVDEPDPPIDMVLHCPKCGMQHIDAPEMASEARPVLYAGAWTNPPHRSHLCHGCGHIWRPADVATNGVAAMATRGKNDSPLMQRAQPAKAKAVESPKLVDRPEVTMYSQAGVAELTEPCGPFISVSDAQDMAAWCVSLDRAMRSGAA